LSEVKCKREWGRSEFYRCEEFRKQIRDESTGYEVV